MLVAVGHIGGSIFVLLVLGAIMLFVTTWETEWNKKHALADVALSLGVRVDELENEELLPRLTQLLSDRYSSELLRNRLSDLCGLLRTGWGWLGGILQLGAILTALWLAFSESPGQAAVSWFAVGFAVFFWITAVAFSLACRLLTGRYPGQAKQVRKSLSNALNSRQALQ